MEISKILEEFDDLYMVCDIHEGKVLEIYPPVSAVNLPCNILSIFRLKKFNMDISSLKEVENLLKNCKNNECITIQGSNGWYSLEFKTTVEGKGILHLYNLDIPLGKMNTILSQSQLDPLTNALQKNAIEIYIDSKLKDKKTTSATVFMLDIDYFKNINDNYGHLFGDKVIVGVANALQSLSGTSGKVGRIGGDEFILFVEHDLDRLGMKNIARLIRYVLDNLQIDGKPFGCTATIGISQYPKDGKTFQELYACCDKALYRGKEKGRDCHIIFDPLLHHGHIDGLETTQENSNMVNKLSTTKFIGQILKLSLADFKKNKDEIFSQISDFINLDRIVMFRRGEPKVEYTKKTEDKNVEAYKDFDFEEYRKNFVIDDMHYINDTKTWEIKNLEVYEIYKKSKTISTVQVLLFDIEENPIGFMSYEMIHSRRVWQRGELNALGILTRIINIIYNHS